MLDDATPSTISEAIAQAHRAAQAVSPEYKSQRALDARLKDILRATNGSTNDEQLAKLRSRFGSGPYAQEDGAAPSVENKRVVRELDDGATEELCWFGSMVIWSRRPSTVIRTFSFSSKVTHACWAQFELGNVALAENSQLPPIGVQQHAAGLGTVAGPSRMSQTQSYIQQARPGGFSMAQDHVRSLSQINRRHAAAQTYSSTKRRRIGAKVDDGEDAATQGALCMFLEHTLVLYFPASGQEHLIHLPFTVAAVFPMVLGVVVQRQAEAEDFHHRQECTKLEHTDGELNEPVHAPSPLTSPLAYQVCRPFDEFAGLDRVTQIIENRPSTQAQTPASTCDRRADILTRPPSVVADSTSSTFPELDEIIVFVSDGTLGSPLPIIVTAHYGRRSLRIYQYGISGVAFDQVQTASTLMTASGSSSGHLRQETQNGTRSQVQGIAALETQSSVVDDIVMTQEIASSTSPKLPVASGSQLKQTARDLGRGRPPPRRSARIGHERRFSGLPSTTAQGSGGGEGGIGSAGTSAIVAGSSIGASQNHRRPSQRTSRRISSSTHGADLRRVSTRAIADRTSTLPGSVGEEIHAGLGLPLVDGQDERGGFAEVMQSINRESQHQQQPHEWTSQPARGGIAMAHRGLTQMADETGGVGGVTFSQHTRTRSASATQRPTHARRSSHLSMSRAASGVAGPNDTAAPPLYGNALSARQRRGGSGSNSIVPTPVAGGVSIGGRAVSSLRRQPSFGMGFMNTNGQDVGTSDPNPRAAVGSGSQFDPNGQGMTSSAIIHQAETIAHEPGATTVIHHRRAQASATDPHFGIADGEDDEQDGLEGADAFARTYGGVALLDEISVKDLDPSMMGRDIEVFFTSSEVKPLDLNSGMTTSSRSATLTTSAVLCISVPSSNVVLSRVISEVPVHYETGNDTSRRRRLGYALSAKHADSDAAAAALEVRWATPIKRQRLSSPHKLSATFGHRASAQTPSDVVVGAMDGSTRLFLGQPCHDQPSIAMPSPGRRREELVQVAATLSKLTCPLTQRVLDALERVLLAKQGAHIRRAVLQASVRVADGVKPTKVASSEWGLLCSELAGCPVVTAGTQAEPDSWLRLQHTRAHCRHHAAMLLRQPLGLRQGTWHSTPSLQDESRRRSGVVVLKVVHLLAQEALLAAPQASDNLSRLAELVVVLSKQLQCHTVAEYWTRILPSAAAAGHATWSRSVRIEDWELKVPTTSEVLKATLTGKGTQELKTEDDLLDAFIGPVRQDGKYAMSICPTLTRLWRVYRSLRAALSASRLEPTRRARALVDLLVEQGIDRAAISELPFGYALPIWEAIRLGQMYPDPLWNYNALDLVDRRDLIQSREDKATVALKFAELQLRTLPAAEALDPLSAVLFGADYRLDEVVKMMYTSGPLTIDFPERDEKKTDADVKDEQSRIYWSVTERIKATPIGKGAFLLTSKPFVDTQLWEVPPLHLELRGEPNALITTWPVNKLADSELEWPEFHNGVAAALSISAEDGQQFESDWIYSHYGAEPSAEHAGFLFGLGLLGRLRSLGRVHAYRYFAPRHSITTIGIVLGLGVSFVGTGDPAVRQLMALQIAAFLPDGSAPLNQSMLTQTAGILGMGLTFLGSYHRWTAERLLAQIRVENVQTSDNPMFLRDAYALSSGFALGLVMLGKGRRDPMTGAADRQLIGSLVDLIEGPQQTLFEGETSGLSSQNTATTNVPATIALALTFLRSNRHDVAEQLLRLPKLVDALEYVRPDMLFARALARHLIMWDDVRADADWMEGSLPPFLRTPPPAGKLNQGSSARQRLRMKFLTFTEPMQLAYLNIHAACCFAIGLKWAGSQNLQAAGILIEEYDAMIDLLRPSPTAYFERIRRTALQTAKDLTLLSCSLILAGSGHLSLLTRLRLEHGKIETTPSQHVYGSYLSSHLALGFLFLGGGRYTFGTSDGAIASLLIACFPRFPANSSENRAHLQAYRHLWVLAVEPRMVVAQDVESGIVESLDAEFKLKNHEGKDGESAKLAVRLPGQAPPFESLEEVRVNSDAFWSSQLRISQERDHARRLLLTRRLPVKRRAGFPSLPTFASASAPSAGFGQLKSSLDGLAADLARWTGHRISSDVLPAVPEDDALHRSDSVTIHAEQVYSLERKTLSSAIGLEHAHTLGRLPGLVVDRPSSSWLDDDVQNLLEAYVRQPTQRAWLRGLLQNAAQEAEETFDVFRQFCVRALISLLVTDAPPEILAQGWLGLFWRATSLASNGGKNQSRLAGDAGRVGEQIEFLRCLYGLRQEDIVGAGTAHGPDPDAPYLLAGLGLAWSSHGAGKSGVPALISPDVVDAAVREWRARAQALWYSGQGTSDAGVGMTAVKRVLEDDTVADTSKSLGSALTELSTIFAGFTSMPWSSTVLRPLFSKTCGLARAQLGAGVDGTTLRAGLARVLDFSLGEMSRQLWGAKEGERPLRSWELEGYVRDALVELALQRASQ